MWYISNYDKIYDQNIIFRLPLEVLYLNVISCYNILYKYLIVSEENSIIFDDINNTYTEYFDLFV